MEDILKKLSEYQIEAYKKGICFSIDFFGNDNGNKEVTINIRYNHIDKETDFSDARAMNISFTPETLSTTITRNFDKIESFIQNVSVIN